MKSITLNDGREFCTNNDGTGLFSRRPEGTWQQMVGNGQVKFKNSASMRRYLRERFGVLGVRIVDARW